jgi:hypothetical protein
VQRFQQRYSAERDVIPTPLEKRSTQPRVLVEELADVCGLPPSGVLTKLASLRVKVGGDWAGRASISLEDAAKAHAKIIGDTQAHTEKWQQYQQYIETREQRREQAAREAAARARAQATKDRLFGDPEREGRASHAARVAREEFEQTNPLLGFDEFRVGGEGK